MRDQMTITDYTEIVYRIYCLTCQNIRIVEVLTVCRSVYLCYMSFCVSIGGGTYVGGMVGIQLLYLTCI